MKNKAVIVDIHYSFDIVNDSRNINSRIEIASLEYGLCDLRVSCTRNTLSGGDM